LNITNTDTLAERTPEAAKYYALLDAFTETLEELASAGLSKQARAALRAELAAQYYALAACDRPACGTLTLHACEAVIDEWRISRTPPVDRQKQRAATNKYEAEYLREVETNLIEAENALRLPRLEVPPQGSRR
jgi:hypothetical protein